MFRRAVACVTVWLVIGLSNEEEVSLLSKTFARPGSEMPCLSSLRVRLVGVPALLRRRSDLLYSLAGTIHRHFLSAPFLHRATRNATLKTGKKGRPDDEVSVKL